MRWAKNVPAYKIKSEGSLLSILKKARRKHARIVFTNGCFDILHRGHISILESAKKQGDILIVGLNSDRSVKILKGHGRPINSQKDRAYVLAALECVDFITIFSQPTPLKLIKKIRPDVLVKGGDWKKETIAGADFVVSCGGVIKCLPYIKSRSSTATIVKINSL